MSERRKIGRLERIAMPALISAFAAGAALAAVGENQPAYGAAISTLTGADVKAHAAALFSQADLDNSGTLSASEFAAASVVTAELARLNGFAAVNASDGSLRTIAIDHQLDATLAASEKERLKAVALRDYYAASGADGELQQDEFVSYQRAKFERFDLNGDGVLRRHELKTFATFVAGMPVTTSA